MISLINSYPDFNIKHAIISVATPSNGNVVLSWLNNIATIVMSVDHASLRASCAVAIIARLSIFFPIVRFT